MLGGASKNGGLAILAGKKFKEVAEVEESGATKRDELHHGGGRGCHF